MVKKEKGIEAIEYADSLLKETLKKYNEYCSRKSFLSEKDSIFEKNGLATQLAFICEIYLKGLLLPHLQINIPDEIKEKIGTLSEEEYMIIVADEEYFKMLLDMEESLDGMPYGKIKYDENIENAILDPTVGDAFVRSLMIMEMEK